MPRWAAAKAAVSARGALVTGGIPVGREGRPARPSDRRWPRRLEPGAWTNVRGRSGGALGGLGEALDVLGGERLGGHDGVRGEGGGARRGARRRARSAL